MTTPTAPVTLEDKTAALVEKYADVFFSHPLAWGVWCAAQGLLTTAEGVAEYTLGHELGDLAESLPILERRGLVQREGDGWTTTPDGDLLYRVMAGELTEADRA